MLVTIALSSYILILAVVHFSYSSIFISQVDSEMALEFATQSGMVDTAREDVYLKALDSSRQFAVELHNTVAVFKLFAGL